MTLGPLSTYWRRASVLVAVGLGCLLLLCLTYLGAVRTARGQRLDERVFQLLFSLVPSGLALDAIVWLARPAVIVALALVAMVLALAAARRRDGWPIAAAAIVTAVSLVTTQVLRDDLLSRPYLTPDPFPVNSLPSMHVSAAAALGVAVLLLWPAPRPPWLVNLVSFAVLITALGNVLSQAHRPSDVVASVLLVGAVGAATEAMLVLGRIRSDLRRPAHH